MPIRDRIFIIIMLLALLVGTLLVTIGSDDDGFDAGVKLPTSLPDFSVYTSVDEKKNAFFEFLLPFIEHENRRVLQLREDVLALADSLQDGEKFSASQHKKLLRLAKKYRVSTSNRDDREVLAILLRRIDAIPPSLALSQSANESAWGTSRFAVQGNNLFGQWCFNPGCGIVPDKRPSGARYEVADFDSPAESIRSYIHNLNTNAAYTDFRIKRAQLRAQQEQLSGLALVDQLTNYSTRRDAYVDDLRSMIRFNNLAEYDRQAQLTP